MNTVENETESISKDELYWSKTCAKLQTENQTLLTDLDKMRTERDHMINQMRQTETNERRDQSTNTPNHTYNRSVYNNDVENTICVKKKKKCTLNISVCLCPPTAPSRWTDCDPSVVTWWRYCPPSCQTWICRASASTQLT